VLFASLGLHPSTLSGLHVSALRAGSSSALQARAAGRRMAAAGARAVAAGQLSQRHAVAAVHIHTRTHTRCALCSAHSGLGCPWKPLNAHSAMPVL
jgi:hypothetical protein